MTNASWHLAQVNIGRFRQPTDHPDNAVFMNNLDRVNAIAEASPRRNDNAKPRTRTSRGSPRGATRSMDTSVPGVRPNASSFSR